MTVILMEGITVLIISCRALLLCGEGNAQGGSSDDRAAEVMRKARENEP